MTDPPEPHQVFGALYRHFGPQHWWPADTRLEVVAGAVLVQNTTWHNASFALSQLRQRVGLEPAAILRLGESELANIIRPSGTYRVKARRLRALFRFLQENDSIVGLSAWPTGELRRALLAVHGIGPETADAILLYAFGRPVFIVDAYARRLFGRLGIAAADGRYGAFASWMESRLPADAALMNELHALVVRQCKDICRRRPRCERCPLADRCATWAGQGVAATPVEARAGAN